MPYIKKEYRPRLGWRIAALIAETKQISKETGENHAFAGFLDHCFTRLAVKTLP